MYGFIFGFHRLARCPKCTPASIRSLTTSATRSISAVRPFRVETPSGNGPGATLLKEWEELGPKTRQFTGDRPRRQIRLKDRVRGAGVRKPAIFDSVGGGHPGAGALYRNGESDAPR